MEKKDKIILILFALGLILFAIFTTKIGFHDSYEYITIAKNFAGIENVNLFSGHSLMYPLIISIFLKIWPSFIMVKFVNVLWVFLIAAILLFWLKNKKAFLLFVFSPLTWYVGVQTTPILPASFFFLLAFLFFYKKDIRFNLIYSGIFFGLACAFYTPMILVAGIFILVYFWKKPLVEIIKYSLALFVGFIPRLLQDYYLFKMPIYSLIRYFGSNFIISFGLHPSTPEVLFLSNLGIFLIVLLISPFLFKIYKMGFHKDKALVIFLVISGLLFLLKTAKLKYFLILSPIILIILSSRLSEKQIKWHCILSVFLVIFMCWNFFIVGEDRIIRKDINNIIQEYDVDYIVVGPYEALKFGVSSWQNQPYFVWWQDFTTSLKNETRIRGYDFKFDSKIPLKDKLEISASFNRFEEKSYENYILVTKQEFPELSEFRLDKCYEKLCVYQKNENN